MHPQLQLDNQLCFRFYTVSRLITQSYYPLLTRLGLSYPQYLVMMVLWEHDSLPVNDIARRLRLRTSTITPLLKRMEQEGLLLRRRDSSDSRRVIVSLTPKGKELEARALNVPQEMAGRFCCAGVDLDTGRELASLLDSLIDSLDPDAADHD